MVVVVVVIPSTIVHPVKRLETHHGSVRYSVNKPTGLKILFLFSPKPAKFI
jgi:hypothetical protein